MDDCTPVNATMKKMSSSSKLGEPQLIVVKVEPSWSSKENALLHSTQNVVEDERELEIPVIKQETTYGPVNLEDPLKIIKQEPVEDYGDNQLIDVLNVLDKEERYESEDEEEEEEDSDMKFCLDLRKRPNTSGAELEEVIDVDVCLDLSRRSSESSSTSNTLISKVPSCNNNNNNEKMSSTSIITHNKHLVMKRNSSKRPTKRTKIKRSIPEKKVKGSPTQAHKQLQIRNERERLRRSEISLLLERLCNSLPTSYRSFGKMSQLQILNNAHQYITQLHHRQELILRAKSLLIIRRKKLRKRLFIDSILQ